MRTFLLSVVLLLLGRVLAAVPDEPAEFGARANDNLILMYSFLSSDCQDGFVEEDVGLTNVGQLKVSGGACAEGLEGFQGSSNGLSIATGSFLNISSTGRAASLEANFGVNDTYAFDLSQFSFETWFRVDDDPTINVEYVIWAMATDRVSPLFNTGTADTLDSFLSYTSRPGSLGRFRISAYQCFMRMSGPQAGLCDTNRQAYIEDVDLMLEAGETYHLVMTYTPNPNSLDYGFGITLNKIGEAFDGTSLVMALGGGDYDRPLSGFLPSTDSRLRVFSELAGNTMGSTVFLHAWYNKPLTPAEIETNFNAGLPNSLPVPFDTFMSINEDSADALRIDQNTSANFDFDNDVLLKSQSIRAVVTGLPAGGAGSGTLMYDGMAVVQDTTVISNFSLLTYHQTTPNEFSIPAGAIGGCNADVAYDTFTYKITDDACTAPTDSRCLSREVTGHVCIVEQNDAPVPTNQTVEARIGSPLYPINVGGTDPDDAALPPGTYGITNGSVLFYEVDFDYGSIFTGPTVGTCNQALTANTWYDLSGGVFVLCYVPTNVNTTSEVIGVDTIRFRVRDENDLLGEETGTIIVTVLNPLTPCDNLNFALAGARSRCSNAGLEEAGIPVFLNAADEVGGRDLEFRINTLPSHGTLCVPDISQDPYTCLSTLSIGDTVSDANLKLNPPKPNVLYTGDAHYFNEYINSGSNPEYIDLAGGFIRDDCATPATGCPDTFSFRAVVDGLDAASPDADYEIYVDSVKSAFPDLLGPSEIVIGTSVFKFATEENSTAVQIVDYDGDMYNIGLSIIPSKGVIRMNAVALSNSDFIFDDSDCELAIENKGCSIVLVSSRLSLLNEALATMELYASSGVGSSDKVQIKLYKGLDNPTDYDGFKGSFGGSYDALMKINLKPLDTEGNNNDGDLGIAVIAGLSAVGLVVFVAIIYALVWFCGKSKKAAKQIRKSIKSVNSRNSTKGLDLEELEAQYMEETQPSCCAACCIIMFPCFACCCAKSQDNSIREEIIRERQRERRESERRASSRHRRNQSSSSQLSTDNHVIKNQRVDKKVDQYKNEYLSNRQSINARAPAASGDGVELQVSDDSIFDWEKHIDKKTGDVYFFNPRTGESSWTPPTVKVKGQTRRGRGPK